ncbi:MAG: SRPBCC family protein [Crocinitomicaceae bacterium]|nr:SRPBCC family protein [Crocinitomicaceae bacterium]
MKFLIKLGFAVLAFLVLVLVVALFVEKNISISRTVEISREKSDVYDYVKYLQNQSQYSVWQKKDPKIKITSLGTDGTVGYISSWKSNLEDVGVGEQEIIGMKDQERIDYELRFKKPVNMTSISSMNFQSTETNSTKLTWEYNASSPYPMNIFFLFYNLDEKLGSDLQTGLENLKSLLESTE